MKSSNKTIILLGTALIITLIAGGVYTFFFIAMRDKTDATANATAAIGELSGKESSLASSVSILKSQAENIDKMSTYFFNESGIVDFTKKIEALGQQSGTTVSIESLEPGLTEKSVPYLSFRVKASGKFADVDKLLVLLENFPGKFEWKTVRLIRDTSLDAQVGTSTARTKVLTHMWSAEVFLSALNFVN